jgi:beta-N-acetylhexosaminidase
MRRFTHILFLLVFLLSLWLPLPAGASAAAAAQGVTPTGTATEPAATPTTDPATPAPPLDPAEILSQMSVADKVGQLFLISFEGNDVSPESDIAVLLRDYRVGGVVLLPGNDNFRNVPVAGTDAAPVARGQAERSTPEQIAELASQLQALTTTPSQPIILTGEITATQGLTDTTAITPTLTVTPTATAAARGKAAKVTATPATFVEGAGVNVPLIVALDWTGDDSSFFAGTGGFSPLPSAMALGATWSPRLAEEVGQVVGRELEAVGVNFLLGPTLDVLDVPRPGGKGDLDTRTFGGDPFWVGQIGKAFIRGVQSGSAGRVLTAAEHFPGQGGSDRRPEEEVPTVQKSVEQLRQIELAPFAAVTAGGDLDAPGTTAAMMTAHIRYRGFQGNIRELTPPISLAPQLQELVSLPEFAAWRAAGGVLVSDALGVPALRRYYDPTLSNFPHRQVAQHAFLAGNDLLYLGRFGLTDEWSEQVTAIKETILFFQEKYKSDSAFRARVDASVERIIRLKLRMHGGNWQDDALSHDPAQIPESVGQSANVTEGVARAAVTLIYPGLDELADRMPSAPLANEKILIFTDTRAVKECPTCDARPIVDKQAIEDIIMRLYGPGATRQVAEGQVRSLSFADLNRLLTAAPVQEATATPVTTAGPTPDVDQPSTSRQAEPAQKPATSETADVEQAISEAQWIIFAPLDYNPEEYPDSAALRSFLAKRSDSLRDKRLVALALRAPYYLDTTEVSKLTAYFGVYSSTEPFLESAVRALFREFMPAGAPPVSVAGINYELIRELEPAPGQIISLSPVGSGDVISGSIQVGSQIELETGVILDRKGHPVPDGTPVDFYLRYPTESLALAPKAETTVDGKARTVVPLERSGELWITAQAGDARDSTRIVLKVGGDTPGTIATVVPTPTSEPTVTPTSPPPSPTVSPTPEPSPTPAAAALPPRPKPRVAFPAFLCGLIGALLAGGLVFSVRRRGMEGSNLPYAALMDALAAALWAGAAAWIAYLLYAVGWLPGSTALQAKGYAWAAGAVTFIGGALTLLWTGRQRARS